MVQLRAVPGMLVLETLFGLLLSDIHFYESIISAADTALLDQWLTEFCPVPDSTPNMWRFIEYVGLSRHSST